MLFTFYIPVPPVEQVCFQTAVLHKNFFFLVIHKIGKEKRNFFFPLRFMTFSNPYRKLANSFLNCIKL